MYYHAAEMPRKDAPPPPPRSQPEGERRRAIKEAQDERFSRKKDKESEIKKTEEIGRRRLDPENGNSRDE